MQHGCTLQRGGGGAPVCISFHTDTSRSLRRTLRQYDKFHLRSCIDSLLMELWRDPTCAASLTAAASGSSALFGDFVGAVLNDLVYLLKDSLQVGWQPCSMVWWVP